MDTGTHILMGATLAGLAYVDPVVSQNAQIANTVLISTIIGSHSPDFDVIAIVRGKNNYIKHHRGETHSIFSILLWPFVIGFPLIYAFNLSNHWLHIFAWIFLSVALHVGLDLLNTYGVQVMFPFSKRWLHFDILAIFEPFIFISHLTGLILWLVLKYNPAQIFIIVYIMSFIYILIKALIHYFLIKKVKKNLDIDGDFYVIPTFNLFNWRFFTESKNKFLAGRIFFDKIFIEDTLTKQESNPVIRATMKTDDVKTFLEFAQGIHVSWIEKYDGYEVNWSDVRFWYNHKLPFGVDIYLDKDLNVVRQKVGWRKKIWDPPYE